MNLDRKSNPII